jgi:hypothetical protein
LLIGRFPRDSVVAMVAVVGAALALALFCGLLTLRTPGEGLRPAPMLLLRHQPAKGS